MVINRSHLPWFIFTAVATFILALLYAARFHPQWLPFPIDLPGALQDPGLKRSSVGGTRLGLLYGTIGFLIFIFAALLGARKKKPLLRVGRVETWLKAHIWLTILTIPLVGFHCGWTWGQPQTGWLLLCYAIVMVSGFFGLAMQQFMPTLMKERLPREVVFEQIPNIRKRILEALEELAGDCTPPDPAKLTGKEKPVAGRASLVGQTEIKPTDAESAKLIRNLIDDEARAYLSARRGDRHRLANARFSESTFRIMKLAVDPAWLPRVEDLQSWVDERRRMDLQTKLQHWLHGWLLVHVPISILLIVITLWHAVVLLRVFIPH